jgi:hypothetical protein
MPATNPALHDIERGFHLEEPQLFVPWLISEVEILRLLGSRARRITVGYVTCSCTSLGALSHQLGFHFTPRANGLLTELEFFRKKYPDEKTSFDEFQSHLESTFGVPHSTGPGIMGHPAYDWQFGPVSVKHFMAYRYMGEEHVRIRRLAAAAPP